MTTFLETINEPARKEGYKKNIEIWKGLIQGDDAPLRLEKILSLIDDNPWIWQDIIDNSLATENSDICDKILERIIHRQAYGMRLDSFFKRCREDKDFAGVAIKSLKKTGSDYALHLGGLIKANQLYSESDPWKELINYIDHGDPLDICIAVTAAGRLVPDKKPEIGFIKKVYSLRGLSSETRLLTRIGIFALYAYTFASDEAEKILLSLAVSNDDVVDFLLNQLQINKSVPINIKFKIIDLVTSSQNERIESGIISCIASFGLEDIQHSMESLKKIAFRNELHHVGLMSYAMNQLGETDPAKCLDLVLSWQEDLVDKTQKIIFQKFFAPDAFLEISAANRDSLLVLLERLSGDASNDFLVVSTIHEFLGKVQHKNGDPTSPVDKAIIQRCIKILEDTARRQGKMRLPTNKQGSLYYCGRVIDLIEESGEKPSPELITQALAEFPSLKDFLSVVRIHTSNPERTPLSMLLSRERISRAEHVKLLQRWKDPENHFSEIYGADVALGNQSYVQHLNDNLSRIDKQEPGTSSIRARLLGSDDANFRSAFSEVEVIGRLRRSMDVSISDSVPTSGGTVKQLDVGVTVNGEKVKIEVITLSTTPSLEYIGFAGISPDRLRDKIIGEFRKHIEDATDRTDTLVIADLSNAIEIDEEFAESAMKGSIVNTLVYDETGKAISDYATRAKDAMGDIYPKTDTILGVLIYKHLFTKDGCIVLRGKFYPNPLVRNKMKYVICSRVEQTLLDIIN